jgi:hypothetical protein
MNFLEFKDKVHGPKKDKMSGDRLYRLERNISLRITWFLYKFFPFIKPNHVTGLSFLILFLVFSLNFLVVQNFSVLISISQLILLYFITITDKIDGELSRAQDYVTQSGMYYDYTVHLFYPFIFYFSIGHYFYFLTGDQEWFFITLLLGVLSVILVSLRYTTLFIFSEIKKKNIVVKDLITKKGKQKKLWPLPIRFLYYLTFMFYAWTLFFYVVIIFISNYNFELALILYKIHIFYTILVLAYTILWHHPKKKLLQKV